MKSIYRFCFDFIFFGHCDLFLRQECFSWLWPNIGWPEMQCGGCPGTRTGSLSPYLCIPLISAGDLQSALDAPSSDRRRHRFCCSSSLSYFVFVFSYDELRPLMADLIQPSLTQPGYLTQLPSFLQKELPARRPVADTQFCSRAEKKSISKKNKYLENFFRN